MTSAICAPTVKIGFSEVIGSWKIIDISLPRIFRICSSEAAVRSMPRNSMVPDSMTPVGLGSSLRMERAVVVLPAPVSPTRPRLCPSPMSMEIPLTAFTVSSSVT